MKQRIGDILMIAGVAVLVAGLGVTGAITGAVTGTQAVSATGVAQTYLCVAGIVVAAVGGYLRMVK